ncbi:hypothetical protein DAI22_07g036901 [Oryza sativa Japonica Group]|nr:hypothetical protein DAI22_07g036901 [Oryza sativa Japonica Group]
MTRTTASIANFFNAKARQLSFFSFSKAAKRRLYDPLEEFRRSEIFFWRAYWINWWLFSSHGDAYNCFVMPTNKFRCSGRV